MFEDKKNAILLLEDGHVFEGIAFGKLGTTFGEICFNTGMTGYQEVFTDPSYTGQILIMDNVHIGNYGVKHTEVESDSVKIRGVIGRNLEVKYSRLQADDSLSTYLDENGIVGIGDIDTRALVIHIRTKGAMNCVISSEDKSVEELRGLLTQCPDMAGLELASEVSTKEPYEFGQDGIFRVACLDYGIKRNILNSLKERGAFVKVFPAKSSLKELLAFDPDGFFLSNGPGDPASMDYAIRLCKELFQTNKPVFGICLGHQIMALASGLSTFKMHHGHRGLNHPVKNLLTGKCEITTQNHGFGVDPESVRKNKDVEITHLNLNDGSVEGLRLKNRPIFSVQYHPESTPGPHDSRYLFDDFVKLIKESKAK